MSLTGGYYHSGMNGGGVNAGSLDKALTESQMTTQSSFSGFSFTSSYWGWDSTGSYKYPILRTLGVLPVPCRHLSWSNGVCSSCGKVCKHESYSGGCCAVCGKACPHSQRTWAVTTKPTRTSYGVLTGTCTVCGSKTTRTMAKYTWDVNKDGLEDVRDVAQMVRYANDLSSVFDSATYLTIHWYETVSDYDEDGTVETSDAAAILLEMINPSA